MRHHSPGQHVAVAIHFAVPEPLKVPMLEEISPTSRGSGTDYGSGLPARGGPVLMPLM